MASSRSMWVHENCLERVRRALHNRFSSQVAFAEYAQTRYPGCSQATTSTFLRGLPVDRASFMSICEVLELDWEELRAITEVFVSYSGGEQERALVQALAQVLRQAKYDVFPPKQPATSKRRVISLKRCEYFVWLLSSATAVSEQAIEEFRQAIAFHRNRSDQRPAIITILIGSPVSADLPEDLQQALNELDHSLIWRWQSQEDTSDLVMSLLAYVREGKVPTGLWVNSTSQILSPTFKITAPVLNQQVLSRPRPEWPAGQVDLASPFYLERPPIEADCYEEIAKPGALIRIKAPRQMGKTSLMARILQRAEQIGDRVVDISLQMVARQSFASSDTFLRWFCTYVSYHLGIPVKVQDHWNEIFDSNTNCKSYFEQYLFSQVSGSITLALDEVDRVFEYEEIFKDFFGLLRALHEESKRRENWKRLRLIVVHSTEVYVPLDINQSPFNVGLAISLPEFNAAQIQTLAQRHQLQLLDSEVQQLLEWIGGHPFLIRLALYQMARQELTLSQLLQTSATSTGIYNDHLRRLELILYRYPELGWAMKQVAVAQQPLKLKRILQFKLQSLGLVQLLGDTAIPRCELYRRAFQDFEPEEET